MGTLAGALAVVGLKCVSLDLDFAFHASQTEPILDEFEEAAPTGALFQAPVLPVISPLLGPTREPVDFVEAVEGVRHTGTVDETTVWVEIGPHPVCLGFARAILPSLAVAVPSLRRGEDNWQSLSYSLGLVYYAGVSYNGDWALTRGSTFYDAEKKKDAAAATSSDGASGRVVVQSGVMQTDFLAASWGHQMKGVGVVMTLHPGAEASVVNITYIDVHRLFVREGIVAQKNTSVPRLIQVLSRLTISAGAPRTSSGTLAVDGSLASTEPMVSQFRLPEICA
ncbi:hypothetical protein VTI74DRAFT_323 [Chaetomium olivicolor]